MSNPGNNHDEEETGTANGTTTTTMTMNGHSGTYEKKGMDDEDTDNLINDKEPDEVEEEDVEDEEEKIFIEMEHEQEEKAVEEEGQQPKEIQAAPTLLRAALQKGEVKADESEEESDQEKKGTTGTTTAEDSAAAIPAASPEHHHHHIHKRVSNKRLRGFNPIPAQRSHLSLFPIIIMYTGKSTRLFIKQSSRIFAIHCTRLDRITSLLGGTCTESFDQGRKEKEKTRQKKSSRKQETKNGRSGNARQGNCQRQRETKI
jgi:hypothetical protein